MKKERMAVLSMLEKGIISAEEAERLLMVLQKNDGKDKVSSEELRTGINSAFNKAGDALSSFAKTVGEKAEVVSKEMEPRIKDVAKKVADKTSEVAENIKSYADKKSEEMGRCAKDDDFVDLEEKDIADMVDKYQQTEEQNGDESAEDKKD